MIDKFKKIAAQKKYVIFNNSINIWGIRRATDTNRFDDIIACFWPKQNKLIAYNITTDPGFYYRENPINVKGTAILVPNQYRSMWSLGWHQGKYEALVQTGECLVYRDANKDIVLDYDAPLDSGWFGINCHHSGKLTDKPVDKWSAGCQVFRYYSDFCEFISICKKEKEIYGNHFTYTLIEKKDLEDL